MTRVVALTGATGFIGGNLISSLRSEAIQIRALARTLPSENRTKLAAPLSQAVDWVKGDLADLGALERLVDGVDAVVHCAGAVRGASYEAFETANVVGTANLLGIVTTAATKPRFLMLSSLAAREPDLSWYARSKAMAEQVVVEAGGSLHWSIFRPTAVYGPGDKEMVPLLNLLRRGWLPRVGESAGRLSFIHVSDLVAAIRDWILGPLIEPGTYEMHDGTEGGYGWDDIARIGERVFGRPVRTLAVPGSLLSTVAPLNLGLARILGRSPMLTPGKVREIRHPDWVCDNTALTEALGWEPKVDFETGLRKLSGG